MEINAISNHEDEAKGDMRTSSWTWNHFLFGGEDVDKSQVLSGEG